MRKINCQTDPHFLTTEKHILTEIMLLSAVCHKFHMHAHFFNEQTYSTSEPMELKEKLTPQIPTDSALVGIYHGKQDFRPLSSKAQRWCQRS